jgi:hypothetical protein
MHSDGQRSSKCPSSKCPSSLRGESYIPILQLADFHIEAQPAQGNLKLSKRYRTTESYNNSPIMAMNGGESDLTSNADRKFGRLVEEDGGHYEGEIAEGLPEGNGVLFFPDGRVKYSGNWLNGKFHGFGTLYNQKPTSLAGAVDYSDLNNVGDGWLKYEGEFFENQKEGFGTVYLSNHEKFSGCFKNNSVEGYGTFYKRDGTYLNGIWSLNKLRY